MKISSLALALVAAALALPATAGTQEEHTERLRQLPPLAKSWANSMQQQVPFMLNNDMTVTKISAIGKTIYIRGVSHISHQEYRKQEKALGYEVGVLSRQIRERATATICNTKMFNDFIAIGGEVKVYTYYKDDSITGFGPKIKNCQ